MSYQLQVLNDKDFEELCKDLLEKELGISLQIFKKGRDKGVDLRYACTKENQIIVQAKHYINSKFSDLKTVLPGEKEKMVNQKHQPERYILMTTLDLSVDQVDKVVDSMSPYIKTSQDVYSKNRIISLIG